MGASSKDVFPRKQTTATVDPGLLQAPCSVGVLMGWLINPLEGLAPTVNEPAH